MTDDSEVIFRLHQAGTKWQLMLNTNTTAQDSQGGRPQKDTGDLTDSGESSRDNINGL